MTSADHALIVYKHKYSQRWTLVPWGASEWTWGLLVLFLNSLNVWACLYKVKTAGSPLQTHSMCSLSVTYIKLNWGSIVLRTRDLHHSVIGGCVIETSCSSPVLVQIALQVRRGCRHRKFCFTSQVVVLLYMHARCASLGKWFSYCDPISSAEYGRDFFYEKIWEWLWELPVYGSYIAFHYALRIRGLTWG